MASVANARLRRRLREAEADLTRAQEALEACKAECALDEEMAERFLHAIDRRDPWSREDLTSWLQVQFPEYLQPGPGRDLNDDPRQTVIGVLREAAAELRAKAVSSDSVRWSLEFFEATRRGVYGWLYTPEIHTAVFALRRADDLYGDPAFPRIVTNLLHIAAECLEIEADRIGQ